MADMQDTVSESQPKDTKSVTSVPKFKAWDTIHNQMSNSFTIIDCINQNQVFVHPENFEFIRFTGLKDKNGVEIFEGDVLQWTGTNFTHDRIINEPFEVRFHKGMWTLMNHKWQEDVTYPALFNSGARDNTSLEVIGNIYENPALIGGIRK